MDHDRDADQYSESDRDKRRLDDNSRSFSELIFLLERTEVGDTLHVFDLLLDCVSARPDKTQEPHIPEVRNEIHPNTPLLRELVVPNETTFLKGYVKKTCLASFAASYIFTITS